MNNTHLLTSEQELSLINSYSRKTLSKDDVYIFTVTLCDNEIDRDFERFSVKSLEQLQELFVGKTGISDHSMRSSDQAARIFYCYTESYEGKKTTLGETYTALKARAYMLKTPKNESLIAEIDGGIKKEVSVGCSVSECICSVCGRDMKSFSCEHTKGKRYNGKLCYGTLENVSDAYEWSFVAVPAQRNAGVTKSFKPNKKEKSKLGIDIIKSVTKDTLITPTQAKEICDYIETLEKMASVGQSYKSHLLSEIERYSLIAMPKVNAKQLSKGCSEMDIDELKAFALSLQKQANTVLPVSPQIKSNAAKTNNNNAFMI